MARAYLEKLDHFEDQSPYVKIRATGDENEKRLLQNNLDEETRKSLLLEMSSLEKEIIDANAAVGEKSNSIRRASSWGA